MTETKKNYKFIALLICILLSTWMLGCKSNKIEITSEDILSTIKYDKPNLKVFIENTGSMDGYMCDGSQLKDAVYDYVSDLNRSTDTTELYYINSKIIPYLGGLTSYIKDLNPVSFRKAGGNTSNTDLGNIIDSVLETVDANTVAIFISDCILDLPEKDAQKFLTNCEIRIKDEIINTQKRVPNLGVEILKLSSDFNGKYFYQNGVIEHLEDVKRPYYMWIFGDKNYLAQLNVSVPFSLLEKYDLGGVVAFTNQSAVPFDILNNSLTSKLIVPSHGDYHVTILADFRTTLQSDEMVKDKKNYYFNNSTIIVNGIYPITDRKSKYSHFIRFTIPKGVNIAQDCLFFKTPPMPLWIVESNDETGTDIKKNINKTTGIKYLIQGVADAYKNEKISTTFNFNVKRK